MNWNKYEVVFRSETEGENSLYQEVSWHSEHRCDVSSLQWLKAGENVPFKPERNGAPNITFRRLTDQSVELTYHNYDGPNASHMTAHKFTLTPDGESFYDYEGAGRYSTTYSIYLEEKNNIL